MFNWSSPHVHILSQLNLVHSHPISLMPVSLLSSNLCVVALVLSPQGCESNQADEEYVWIFFFPSCPCERRQFWLPEIISCLYCTQKTPHFPNLKLFSKSVYWETLDRARTNANSSWNVPHSTLLFVTRAVSLQIRPAVYHLVFQLWLCDQWRRESDPVLPCLSLVSWGWQPAPTWQLCSENPTLPSHMYKSSHVASHLFMK